MSKQERNIKRPKHSFVRFLFSLGLLAFSLGLSAGLGILLAVWQPSWFGSVPVWQPRSGKEQKIVLSTGRLFLPQESALRPEALPLLDQTALRLPAKTGNHIRVVAYPKPQSKEVLNLAYQRAVAVKEYLSKRPGGERYYWFASAVFNPQANDTTDRIEIVIFERD